MTTQAEAGTVRHRIGHDGSFSLRTVAGSVQLIGTDADEVVLRARLASSHEAPELDVRRYEGGLHVEPERSGRTFPGASFGIGLSEIEFEVEVPRSARIEVNTVSADIRAFELHGDQSFKLVSGDLELDAAGGRLEAKSVSGDMRLYTALPVEVDAGTTSGSLEVEGTRLELIRLRSVSGDVSIEGVLADGPEHRVETVSGDLRIRPVGGLTLEAVGPLIGLRSAVSGKPSSARGSRGLVIGDGAARLRFRSMSGELSVEEPLSPSKTRPAADPIDILRAVERGELDVEQAARLLGEEDTDA